MFDTYFYENKIKFIKKLMSLVFSSVNGSASPLNIGDVSQRKELTT